MSADDQPERRVKMLESENETLRERIAELQRALIGEALLPREWRLTPREQCVMGVLLQREVATKDAIMAALYSLDIDGGAEPKIVDVFICKIRKKLKLFGIEITTHWGRGFSVDSDLRKRFSQGAFA